MSSKQSKTSCMTPLSDKDRRVKIAQCPIMASLLERKVLSIEGLELVGQAWDGIVVSLGDVSDIYGIDRAENYLTSHPSPSDW
jgi:hypothetical protein